MSIKRIKKIIEELDEGKQVGTLYHFTNADKFIHILKDNSLKSSRRQPDNGYGGYGYISFTRDKNFNKIPRGSISGTAIVFIVDGDKLSNRFKIEPFNYYNYFNDIPFLYEHFKAQDTLFFFNNFNSNSYQVRKLSKMRS